MEKMGKDECRDLLMHMFMTEEMLFDNKSEEKIRKFAIEYCLLKKFINKSGYGAEFTYYLLSYMAARKKYSQEMIEEAAELSRQPK